MDALHLPGAVRGGVILLFAAVSFLALRELVSLVPSRRGDHATLVAAFFVAVPVQYGLLWVEWYGMVAIFVPVWVFLALSIRIALSGDTERFLHRVAALQYALMIGVYCVSHAPALLLLRVPGYEGHEWRLLLLLVGVVQLGDRLRERWGFAPGVLAASGVFAALWWTTPFGPLEAFGLGLLATLAGSCGGIVMAALRRDAGILRHGNLLTGRGGVMDRVDSLAFAAPLFFHAVRWGWSAA